MITKKASSIKSLAKNSLCQPVLHIPDTFQLVQTPDHLKAFVDKFSGK